MWEFNTAKNNMYKVLRKHTSVILISSLSSMPSTPRHPWLTKLYSPGSSLASNFSGDTVHAHITVSDKFT